VNRAEKFCSEVSLKGPIWFKELSKYVITPSSPFLTAKRRSRPQKKTEGVNKACKCACRFFGLAGVPIWLRFSLSVGLPFDRSRQSPLQRPIPFSQRKSLVLRNIAEQGSDPWMNVLVPCWVPMNSYISNAEMAASLLTCQVRFFSPAATPVCSNNHRPTLLFAPDLESAGGARKTHRRREFHQRGFVAPARMSGWYKSRQFSPPRAPPLNIRCNEFCWRCRPT